MVHRHLSSLALGSLAFVCALGMASEAHAKPNVERKGGQWGVLLGGSACIPGKAECDREEIGVDGETAPSFGANAELGYRFNKWVFLWVQMKKRCRFSVKKLGGDETGTIIIR